MMRSILVVCTGNICRSVAGERMLRAGLPERSVSSAGLGAVVGAPADRLTAQAAADRGISLDGHAARQMTAAIGAAHDLILAMTPAHRAEIMHRHPQLSGRTLLFDHWIGGRGIDDPHGQPPAVHARIVGQIAAAAEAWIARLGEGA